MNLKQLCDVFFLQKALSHWHLTDNFLKKPLAIKTLGNLTRYISNEWPCCIKIQVQWRYLIEGIIQDSKVKTGS